jgi:ADP-ribose pyrophosphatase YjhB (NUDIX family)
MKKGKRAWKKSGQLAFWVSLPLLYFYLRFRQRSRVLVVSQGNVLLVKGWLGTGKWILPGGGIHRGEMPNQAVVRELREETNIVLKLDQLRSLGRAVFQKYGLKYNYHRFAVELPTIIEPRVNRLEITEAAWLPITDINASNAEQDVINLLEAWKASS